MKLGKGRRFKTSDVRSKVSRGTRGFEWMEVVLFDSTVCAEKECGIVMKDT